MAFLTGRTNAVQDRRFELDKDAVTIGRRNENVIVIADPSVSSRHLVILREGESLTFEALIAFLRSLQIASYKLPERLEVVTQFPLSPVGKILKRELRDTIAARLDAEAGV